jgi:hypothetical protein
MRPILGLAWPVAPQPEAEQRENQGRDDRRADQRGRCRRSHLAQALRERRYRHDQRQLGGAEDAERRSVAQ